MPTHSFGLSDTGLTRSKNEDAWVAFPEIGFWALADGMGGYPGGEVASREVLNCLKESVDRIGHDLVEAKLESAIEASNRWVLHVARSDPSLNGMATTLCCLLFRGANAYLAHVGDSRIYRLRNKSLELLTRDHSRLVEWYLEGKTSKRPQKHFLTRGIGLPTAAKSDISVHPLAAHDLFLLCSDGLSDSLSFSEIEEILNHAASPEEAGKELVETAKKKKGHDNITALVVRFEPT